MARACRRMAVLEPEPLFAVLFYKADMAHVKLGTAHAKLGTTVPRFQAAILIYFQT